MNKAELINFSTCTVPNLSKILNDLHEKLIKNLQSENVTLAVGGTFALKLQGLFNDSCGDLDLFISSENMNDKTVEKVLETLDNVFGKINLIQPQPNEIERLYTVSFTKNVKYYIQIPGFYSSINIMIPFDTSTGTTNGADELKLCTLNFPNTLVKVIRPEVIWKAKNNYNRTKDEIHKSQTYKAINDLLFKQYDEELPKICK